MCQIQESFFSGHYQKFGLNVQVVSDANLRIVYAAVAGNGKTNDCRAFRKLFHLKEWLDSLPDGFFIIGNNAYELSNRLLIPFSGPDKFEDKTMYIIFLSQLRIRVEMTFGLLTTKWCIFRKDLPHENGTQKNCQIIRVAMKLHNYVINADHFFEY